ncbi:von Willebrand factor [Planctomycetes bacterium CA13]|uniref:von Willebrand factor n=1 Tax=Novipirellula herctigrandis TaxID=2527986 RepID=A0A5C5ZBY8_9BACT|nr:von Willebrand factor [Planctomycetes bacterium CA13]
MNEESHNRKIDPQLEARIVALVMGEASELERDQLSQLMEENPELATLKSEYESIHGLMREVAAGETLPQDDDWKLSAEKRHSVLAVLDGKSHEPTSAPVHVQSSERRRWWTGSFVPSYPRIAAILSVAGCLGLLAFSILGLSISSPMASRSVDSQLAVEEYEAYLDAVPAGEGFSSGGTSIGVMIENAAGRPAADVEYDFRQNSKSSLSRLRASLDTESPPPSPYYVDEDAVYSRLIPNAELPDVVGAPGEAPVWEDLNRESVRPLSRERSSGQTTQNYSVTVPNAPSSGVTKESERLGTKDSVWVDPGPLSYEAVQPTVENFSGPGRQLAESDLAQKRLPEIEKKVPEESSIALGIQEMAVDEKAERAVRGKRGQATFGDTAEGRSSRYALDGIDVDNDGDGVASAMEWFGGNGAMGGGISGGARLEQLENAPGNDHYFFGVPPSDVPPQTPRFDFSRTDQDVTKGLETRSTETVSEALAFHDRRIKDLEDDIGLAITDKLGRKLEAGKLVTPSAKQDATPRVPTQAALPQESSSAPAAVYGHDLLGDFAKAVDQTELLPKKKGKQIELQRQLGQQMVDGERFRGIATRAYGEKAQSKFTPAKKRPAAAGLNEKNALEDAFSTFSLHVSDVSFKLAQAALARGEWPETAKIRIEEFVNAFDYGDPMPSQDEKVACRLEQSIHPFLQQRNLLRVAMRTAAAGRASNTPLRLTFLLDNSGSMERIDRQQTVRRAFAMLAGQLKSIDQVTLISFARQPRLLADKVSGSRSNELVQLIENLPSEGGTNIEAALQLAFEKAQEQQADDAQNRVILLTDGAVNLGDANPNSLAGMITTMRDAGIAFDAAGISAEGLNDEILEALTRKGDGRYYLLDSIDSADDGFARQIAGALRPSAKNVKVQVEFNPKRVGRYKLLGFEKHMLKQEDFRNDKVDAAEMAAAEAGVAVYQFEARPDGEGDVGSVSVRFRDLSTGQMIENRWPIPYKTDAARPDQAAPSMRIATTAAMFSAKLRGEPLGEMVDLKTLSDLISGLPDRDRNAKRVQQLQLMIDQARQVSGE